MFVLFLFFLLLLQEFIEDLLLQVSLSFNSGKDLLAVELRKGSCDDRGLGIALAKDLYAFSDLSVAGFICSCQNDRARALDLIDEEFAEVLHIELALGRIDNRYSAVKFHIRTFCRILNRLHYIGELTDTGGLDQNPVGSVLIHNFPE